MTTVKESFTTDVGTARMATQNMYIKRLKKCALDEVHKGKANPIEYEGLKWVASWIGMSGRVNRKNFIGLVKAIKSTPKDKDIEFYIQWR